jgi:hypothetical protein
MSGYRNESIPTLSYQPTHERTSVSESTQTTEATEASAIGEAYQEANLALDTNRRELSEQTAKINADPDLSDDAKGRYIDEARAKAQERYVQTIDGHEKAVADTLEANEKRLFKLSYPENAITDLDRERYRSSYRQAALSLLGADEETVSRAMSRAFRTGDAVLAQACYHESIERGLSEVGDEYRQRHPKAAEAWNIYVRDRRAAESRQHILASALLKKANPGSPLA